MREMDVGVKKLCRILVLISAINYINPAAGHAEDIVVRIGVLKGNTAPEDITTLSYDNMGKLLGSDSPEDFQIISQSDDEIVFEIKRPKSRLNPNQIIFKFFANENTLIAALATGQVDFAKIDAEETVVQVNRASKDVTIRWSYKTPNTVKMVAYNCSHSILRYSNVRKALSYAINKDYIVKNILNGKCDIASGPFQPHSKVNPSNLDNYGYDPKMALRLLNSNGWLDNNGDAILELGNLTLSFTLLYDAGLSIDEKIIRLIKHNLNEIGVDVRPTPLEKKEIKARLLSGNFDAVLTEHQFDESITALENFFSPEKPTSYLNYHNPTLRNRLAFFHREKSPERKDLYFKAVQKTINEEQPVTFLYFKWIHYYIINYQKFSNFLDTNGQLRPIQNWNLRTR